MIQPSDEFLQRLIARFGFDPELIKDDALEEIVNTINQESDADLDERKRRTFQALMKLIAAEEAVAAGQQTAPGDVAPATPTAAELVQLSTPPPQPRHVSFEPAIALGGRDDEAGSDETNEWVIRLAPTDEQIEYRQGTSERLAEDLFIRLTWMPADLLIEFSLSGSLGVGRHVNRTIAYASSASALESAVRFSPDSPEVTTWTAEIEKSHAPRSGDLLRVDYTDARAGLAIVIRTTL